MANYYVTGYTTPSGVASREDVRTYQKQLGVKADGVWGPITQAAYERSQMANGGLPDVFENYYNSLMNSFRIPTVSVDAPSREELVADYSTMLRPGVELAIGNRRKQGETAKAEMDADAYSRGMGASTYVSSLKEREGDDVEGDVTMLEAQYTAALAERVAASLEKYAALQLQANSINTQYAFGAQNAAMNLASQWYSTYLAGLGAGNSGGGGGGGYDPYPNSSHLRNEDYVDFVQELSGSERAKLYYSSDEDWAACREEVIQALGYGGYNQVRKDNPCTSPASGSGSLGGGGGQWTASQR